MRFKYIGLKVDGERAFKERTGIEWMPDSEHDVTDADVCAEMLRHPTIWQPVEAQPVTLAQAKPAAPVNTSAVVTDEEADLELQAREAEAKGAPAADDLDAMDPDALRALADQLGVKVHHKAGADKVREAIRAARG